MRSSLLAASLVSARRRRRLVEFQVVVVASLIAQDRRTVLANTARCGCGLTENDGHEIEGQDIYRLKIDYITMQCAILFKTTAEYKSPQRSKLYRPPVIVAAHTDESVDTSTAETRVSASEK